MYSPSEFQTFQRCFIKSFLSCPEFIDGVGLRIGIAPDDRHKQLFLLTPFSLINGLNIFERMEVINHIGIQMGMGGRMNRYGRPGHEAEIRRSLHTLMWFLRYIFAPVADGPSWEYRVLMAFNAFEVVKRAFTHADIKRFMHNYEIATSLFYILIVLNTVITSFSNIIPSSDTTNSTAAAENDAAAAEDTSSIPPVPVIMKMVSEITNFFVFIVESFFEYIYNDFASNNFQFVDGEYNAYPSMVVVNKYSQQFMHLVDFISSTTIQRNLLEDKPILIYGIMSMTNEHGFGWRMPIVALESDDVVKCMKLYKSISKNQPMDLSFDSIANKLMELQSIIAPMVNSMQQLGVATGGGSVMRSAANKAQNIIRLAANKAQSEAELVPRIRTSVKPFIDGIPVSQESGEGRNFESDSLPNIFNRIQSILNEIPCTQVIINILLQNEFGVLHSIMGILHQFHVRNLSNVSDAIRYILTGYYRYTDSKGNNLIGNDNDVMTDISAETYTGRYVSPEASGRPNLQLNSVLQRLYDIITSIISNYQSSAADVPSSESDEEVSPGKPVESDPKLLNRRLSGTKNLTTAFQRLSGAKNKQDVVNAVNSVVNPQNNSDIRKLVEQELDTPKGNEAVKTVIEANNSQKASED